MQICPRNTQSYPKITIKTLCGPQIANNQNDVNQKLEIYNTIYDVNIILFNIIYRNKTKKKLIQHKTLKYIPRLP